MKMFIEDQEIKLKGKWSFSNLSEEDKKQHICGMEYRYNNKYKSYYCKECDIWLYPIGTKIGIKGRPEKPSDII